MIVFNIAHTCYGVRAGFKFDFFVMHIDRAFALAQWQWPKRTADSGSSWVIYGVSTVISCYASTLRRPIRAGAPAAA
eukprot:scaffold2761_cov148-Isochrysis_galbana.AAC.1